MAIFGILIAVAVAFLIGNAIAGPVLGLVAAAAVGLLFRWIAGQATTGLFRANLNAYGVARSHGLNHEDSLRRVISSRYPTNPGKRTEIASQMHLFTTRSPDPRVPWEERQMQDLRTLIWLIFINENGLPPTQKLVDKYTSQLDRALVHFAERYATRNV
jgi:hypothetical protein